jgi:hypothetical protein
MSNIPPKPGPFIWLIPPEELPREAIQTVALALANRDYYKAIAERAVEALKEIASGDASKVSSPIGSLHAAGIVTGWLECKEIAEKALAELNHQDFTNRY